VSEKLIIDGEMVSIKITKEWGFNFGDDVCLYDEDEKSATSSQGNVESPDELDLDNNVVMAADKIVNDLVQADVDSHITVDGVKRNEEAPTTFREAQPNVARSTGRIGSPATHTSLESLFANGEHVEFTKGSEMERVGAARTSKQLGGGFEVGEESKAAEGSALRKDEAAVARSEINPESSLGSAEDRSSIRSGPWSVDWLQNIQHGDIGLISSKHKRLKMVRKNSGSKAEGPPHVVKRKKAGGVLRHPVVTLKKVARLPSTDREEVMKVLQGSKKLKVLHQKIRQRRRQREKVTRSLEVLHQSTKSQSTSSASVNNDWTNWVALHGSDESKAADIQAISNTIDISFSGVTHNTFSVLARPTGVSSGPILTPVAVAEGVVDGGV